jgi:hypothetical protein
MTVKASMRCIPLITHEFLTLLPPKNLPLGVLASSVSVKSTSNASQHPADDPEAAAVFLARTEAGNGKPWTHG